MTTPLVCICIPCFNASRTIEVTLKSILNQTYLNVEIHVFDNASTDNTLELVRLVNSNSIRIHTSDKTNSAEWNFTRCLNLGRGDYTAIYHADDLYEPTIVEKEVEALEKNKSATGALTFANCIDERGVISKKYLAPSSLDIKERESKILDLPMLFKSVLKNNNFLFCPSAMIRTSHCVNYIKSWRGKLFKSSADLDLWFRVANCGGLILLNEALLNYRVFDLQFTDSYRRKRQCKSDMFLVLDYWLTKKEIRNSLTTEDKGNYKKLMDYDFLGQVLNAIRNQNFELARDKMLEAKFSSIFRYLFDVRSIKAIKFLVLLSLLKLMLVPVSGNIFRNVFLKKMDKIRL